MSTRGLNNMALGLMAAVMTMPIPDRPIMARRSRSIEYQPLLHKTKGWRGVKKKHRAKFKRRGRKS